MKATIFHTNSSIRNIILTNMMLLLSNGYLFFYVRSLNLARIASGVGGQPFT